MFNQDIIIDQEAFAKAINEFEALSARLEKLRIKIEGMMDALEKGFDTPAGRKFLSSCTEHLFQPMKDQKVVLEHLAETLRDAQNEYAAVFTKYDELNTAVKRIGES